MRIFVAKLLGTLMEMTALICVFGICSVVLIADLITNVLKNKSNA